MFFTLFALLAGTAVMIIGEVGRIVHVSWLAPHPPTLTLTSHVVLQPTTRSARPGSSPYLQPSPPEPALTTAPTVSSSPRPRRGCSQAGLGLRGRGPEGGSGHQDPEPQVSEALALGKSGS